MTQTLQRPTLERDRKAAVAAAAAADYRCLLNPSHGPKQCYNNNVVRFRKRKLTSQAKKHLTFMSYMHIEITILEFNNYFILVTILLYFKITSTLPYCIY